jgi:hypothetical protein
LPVDGAGATVVDVRSRRARRPEMSTVTADTIVFGAKVTTLEVDDPDVTTAFAVRGERFLGVGAEAEVMRPGHRRCGTPPLSATATDMHC